MNVELTIPILKRNEALRVVYGWASVISENDTAVIDAQGDTITADELVRAAHHFMLHSRQSKAMHHGETIGQVVESFVLTPDVTKALGISVDKVGWVVAIKIFDDVVWQNIQAGIYRDFSIGGRAKRERKL